MLHATYLACYSVFIYNNKKSQITVTCIINILIRTKYAINCTASKKNAPNIHLYSLINMFKQIDELPPTKMKNR